MKAWLLCLQIFKLILSNDNCQVLDFECAAVFNGYLVLTYCAYYFNINCILFYTVVFFTFLSRWKAGVDDKWLMIFLAEIVVFSWLFISLGFLLTQRILLSTCSPSDEKSQQTWMINPFLIAELIFKPQLWHNMQSGGGKIS